MSADNFVGVRPREDGGYDIFEYGCMSAYEEDCMYLKDANPTVLAETREKALVEAHDIVNEMMICEYGVVEMRPVPKDFCGHCYVCINVRGIVAENIERCTACDKPFSNSDWRTITSEGTFHSRCEPRRT